VASVVVTTAVVAVIACAGGLVPPWALSRWHPSCRRGVPSRGVCGRGGAAVCAPRCESENGPGEWSKADAGAVSVGMRQSQASVSYLRQAQVGE
jgi:hypothetical protein